MKIKKISNILIGLSVTLCFNSYGQTLLTAKEAVKIALENNYSISIARNDKEIADNNYSLGNAGMLPSIDANGSYIKSSSNTKQEYFDNRVIDKTGAKATNLAAGVDLSWTIFDGLKMFASYGQLKALKKLGDSNFKLTVENNISQVINTYFDLVREEQVLNVIKQNMLISEERVKIAQSKKEVGAGSKFDLLQAQVDLNEDKSSLLTEELKFANLKTQLNQLLGRDSQNDFKVEDTIAVRRDLVLDDLQTAANKENSRLLIAEQNKNISQYDYRISSADWFPKISVNVGYDYGKSESEAGFLKTNQSYQLSYGLTASFNIFNGFNNSRKVENAKIEIKNSGIAYQQIVNDVNSVLWNFYQQYQNGLKLISLEKENLATAQENVDIALEKLRLGNITPVEFREAQKKLLDAKSRLLSAEYQAKVAETNLLKESGLLIKSK